LFFKGVFYILAKIKQLEALLFIYLAIECFGTFVTFTFFPVTGWTVTELLLLVNKIPLNLNILNSFTRRARIGKRFQFTGWLYSKPPTYTFKSLTGAVLTDFHPYELMDYCEKKHKETGSNVIKIIELDFLSEHCREILSLIHYKTYGSEGASFYPPTKKLIDKYCKI
jgi:hypothetical protein